MTNLEQEFKDYVEKARTEINAAVTKAEEALDSAVKISEEYGIPFTINLGTTRQDYEPKSFKSKIRNSKKFKPLYEEDYPIIDDLEVFGNAYSNGWTNSSATC